MARRLVLHIGAMKSGTSFVQSVLSANADRLAERGLLWPGRRWLEQAAAVIELIERGPVGPEQFAPDGPWRRLVEEVRAWDGDAIVSMEFLGPRDPATIEVVLDAFAPASIDIVVTARDLSRQLPAMWQESVQNGGGYDWPDYVTAVRDFPGVRSKPGRSFWRQQSIDETVARWTEAVGRDHLTLVTVPPSGGPAGVLWDRFVEATGIPGEACAVAGPANPSIGTASAMVLRELNLRLDAPQVARADYDAVVKYDLAKTVLAGRGEPTVGCDEPWLRERAEHQLARLRRLAPRVVGDLEDLTPHPVPGIAFEDLSLTDRLEAATDGLTHVVRLAQEQRQEIKRLRRRLRRQRVEDRHRAGDTAGDTAGARDPGEAV